MKFIKIQNLQDYFNQVDYKGLDINKFISGSQVYMPDLSYCIIATTEDAITNNSDIQIISEVMYQEERQTIIDHINNLPKVKTLEETGIELEQVKLENAELKQAVLDLTEIVLGV